MIYCIKGEILEKHPNKIVLFTNDIGYQLNITFQTYANVGQVGDVAKLYTYLHVREDLLELFGFSSKIEEEWFRLLITVSGVGPKAGLAILSELTVDQLTLCLINEDFKTLTMCQGIGLKTAQRVVLELKDKMKKLTHITLKETPSGINDTPLPMEDSRQTVAALMALGYSSLESNTTVRQIDGGLSVEESIKAALKILSGKVQ